MSSELSGSRGDRPEPGDRADVGDRPRETGSFGDAGRDVTPVPASAGRGAGGITRAEAYGEGAGSPGDAGRGDGDRGDAGRGDGGRGDVHAGSGDGGRESPEGADVGRRGESARGGLEVRESPASASAAGAGDAGGERRRPPASPDGVGRDRGELPSQDGYAASVSDRRRPDREEAPGAPAESRALGSGPEGGRDGARDERGPADGGRRSGPEAPEQESRRPDADPEKQRDVRGDGETQEKQSGDRPAERDREKPQQLREAHPDAGLDTGQDQAIDQLKASLKTELKNDIKAELREELKAEFEAEHKAETDSIRVETDSIKAENQELRLKVGALESRLEEGQQESPASPNRPSDAGDRPGASRTPDVTRPGERGDVPVMGDDGGEDAGDADIAVIDKRADDESGKEGVRGPAIAGRHVFTAENVTAAGAGLAFGQAVAQMFGSVPAEVGVTAAGVALFGAAMETKLRDFVHKIRRKD